jgi:alpha-tubulin suppressor-like RCC1 family protein
MNVTNLILQLQSKITANALDQQMASKAIKLLNLGTIESLGSLLDLPPASNNLGKIYYIIHDGLYLSLGEKGWVPMAKDVVSEIYCWGSGTYSNVPELNTITSVFVDWCQIRHNTDNLCGVFGFGVRTNGTLWSWGVNGNGQLGDNSTIERSSPVLVVGGFTDWCQVASRRLATGGSFAHGLRKNGTIWSWGTNTAGLGLGDGPISGVGRSSPVSVAGGFTDWCQLAASFDKTSGIRSNGSLWSWGCNQFGQLGTGNNTCTNSPVSVVGGFTDWCQVSGGGGSHSLAVRTNGTAWAWGCNGNGQFGNNSTTNRSSPVSVVGGFTDWCQVSAGSNHSLGLRTNGTLWAWGYNGSGQLGTNTITARSSPVSVVGGFTDWCQVSGGQNQSFGIKTNGTLWSWGNNQFGRLGDGTTVNKSSPVLVLGGFTDWCQVDPDSCNKVAALRSFKL